MFTAKTIKDAILRRGVVVENIPKFDLENSRTFPTSVTASANLLSHALPHTHTYVKQSLSKLSSFSSSFLCLCPSPAVRQWCGWCECCSFISIHFRTVYRREKFVNLRQSLFSRRAVVAEFLFTPRGALSH